MRHATAAWPEERGDQPKAREFRNALERDDYVEASYSSDCGKPADVGMPAWMAEHCLEFADLFWTQRHGIQQEDLAEAIRTFESRTFGAHLEPAAHGLLMREIRRAKPGLRREYPAAPFVSAAEEALWLRAAGNVAGFAGDSERHIKAIIAEAQRLGASA